MTTEYKPRLFERDEDIRAIGEGLLAAQQRFHAPRA